MKMAGRFGWSVVLAGGVCATVLAAEEPVKKEEATAEKPALEKAAATNAPAAKQGKNVKSLRGAGGKPGQPWELQISGAYLFPGEDYFWDKAYGASAKMIYWINGYWGLALAAGLEKWKATEDVRHYPERGPGYIFLYDESIDGDATMIPLGGSVLARVELARNLSLMLEGGLRYVLIQSDLTLTDTATLMATDGSFFDTESISHDIDMDNTMIALFAADVGYELQKNVRLFAGAGYQFDLNESAPTITHEGEDIESPEDNSLKAAFVRAGLAVQF